MADGAGFVQNVFTAEYVPEAPGSFTKAHRDVMARAISWAMSVTHIYDLNYSKAEYMHQITSGEEGSTPGKRTLQLTARFYSFRDQGWIDQTEQQLRLQLRAMQEGANG